MNTLSPQQIEAGLAIIDSFGKSDTPLSGPDTRWTILQAQMQSGKTGTYLFVAAEMIRRNVIDHVIICSGNAETALREQVRNSIDDVCEQYLIYIFETNPTYTIEMLQEIRTLLRKIKNSINVVWGSELLKYHNHNSPEQRTLIILDESHTAQNKTMRPNKFLNRMGIYATGDYNSLKETNTFVLSVSATPFSEISNLVHKKNSKCHVLLQPGEGYMSIEQMIASQMIIGFVPGQWELVLINELKLRAESNLPPKYLLVRIKNTKTTNNIKKIYETIQNSELMSPFYECKTYDSGTTPINGIENINSLDLLAVEPVKSTVLFIKEKCRMGQVLTKSHIGFCMETACKTKTDTALQGLLGRMCGYHNNTNIRIIISNCMIQKETQGELSELDRYIMLTKGDVVMPTNGANLATIKTNKRLKNVTDNRNYPIIPLKVILICEDRELDPQGRYLRETIRAEFIKRENIINKNGYESEQTLEIWNQIENEENFDLSIHKITSSNNKTNTNITLARKMRESIEMSKPQPLGSSNGVSDGKVDIWYFEVPMLNGYFRKGDVYINTRTMAENSHIIAGRDSLHAHNISETTHKEMFCSSSETGRVEVDNGSYNVTMNPASADNKDIMESAIRAFITLPLPEASDAISFPRRITSNQTANSRWKGIYVTSDIFKSLQKHGTIYESICKDHPACKLKIKKCAGRVPIHHEDYIRLAEISW